MSVDKLALIIKKPKICGDKCKFVIKEKDQNSKLKKKENGQNSKLKKVEIRGFQDQGAVLFRIDADRKPLSHYLSDGDHLKACDAIVACTHGGQDYLIFIEMKSKSLNKPRITKQFKSSQCFIDYCDSILKQFHNSQYLQKCQKRFVVFYLPSCPIPKTTTRRKRDLCASPNKPKFLPYSKPVWVGQIL